MELDELIRLKGSPAEIPNHSRDDLPGLFKKLGFKRGAEIGVWDGRYSELFCREGFRHYAVDPWMGYRGYAAAGNDKLNSKYRETVKRLSKYPNCTILRQTSMDALDNFDDNSLDYVYIDGNHGFRYIAEDIVEWPKKVRKGGIISGHDYVYFPESTDSYVKHIVDAYTQAFGIKNWYVIGSKSAKGGEIRDKWRSFMWFKP